MRDAPHSRPRVIFVNRFYWPEEPATAQLLTDLAEGLVTLGFEVTVITSLDPKSRTPAREVRGGVAIHRVRTGRGNGAAKVLTFLSFHLGAAWRLLTTVSRGDTIVALTDPPLIGVTAWWVSRVTGARIVHWVQDIYPEIAVALTAHRWLKVLTPLRNHVWKHSEAIVTLGRDMAQTVASAGVPSAQVHLVPNWAPAGVGVPAQADVVALRRAWGLEGKLVVAYSGNLGRVHDLEPLLDLATQLKDDADLVFLLIGAGPQRARLMALAAERGLANVQFRPPQPRQSLNVSLAVGDLQVITLLPGCEAVVFPSKFYGVLAVGRPVLFIGPKHCELAQVIRERALGRTFTRDELAAMAEFLRGLRKDRSDLGKTGANALAFAAAMGGATSAARQWSSVLAAAP